METIVEYARKLVYSLLSMMPSPYQKASFEALMGLFLEGQGHPLPEHTQVKSPSSLSRFLNQYQWPTRRVIRQVRRAILEQVAAHSPRWRRPLQVLIDLTTLPKCGKFKHLSTATSDPEQPDPWVRMLNGKRGLHLVVLYLVVGDWRIPWSFRVWRGKGHPSPGDLARKLLATVPPQLTQNRQVLVLADTEFGTESFLSAVRRRKWRAVVGMRSNRKLQDGRSLQQLFRNGKRGQQVRLTGFDYPLTVSWFYLKQADGKRQLRFVVSTHPYSGPYLVMLGRNRWAIEGFFKTVAVVSHLLSAVSERSQAQTSKPPSVTSSAGSAKAQAPGETKSASGWSFAPLLEQPWALAGGAIAAMLVGVCGLGAGWALAKVAEPALAAGAPRRLTETEVLSLAWAKSPEGEQARSIHNMECRETGGIGLLE